MAGRRRVKVSETAYKNTASAEALPLHEAAVFTEWVRFEAALLKKHSIELIFFSLSTRYPGKRLKTFFFFGGIR